MGFSSGFTNVTPGSGGTATGTGDVVGPSSSTASALATFSNTTGKLLSGTQITVGINGDITLPTSATIDGRDPSADGEKLDGLPTSAYATVGVNGVSQSQAGRINFSLGTGVSISGSYNAGTNSTDLVISASVQGSPGAVQFNSSGTLAGLSPTFPGDVLVIDTTGSVSFGSKYSRNVYEIFEEWIFDSTSPARGAHNWQQANTGTGATSALIATVTDANHVGVMSYQAGTTTTGRAALTTSATSMIFGTGSNDAYYDTLIQIVDLSTLAERYTIHFGFGDNAAGSGYPTDGAIFEYSDNLSSGNWRAITEAAGVATTTDTTIAAVEDIWTRLTILVHNSSVLFYINNVLVATHSTNVPTGATQQFGVMAGKVEKSTGTTNRTIAQDYVHFRKRLSR